MTSSENIKLTDILKGAILVLLGIIIVTFCLYETPEAKLKRTTVESRLRQEYARQQRVELYAGTGLVENTSYTQEYGKVTGIDLDRHYVRITFENNKVLTIRAIPHHSAGAHLGVKYE